MAAKHQAVSISIGIASLVLEGRVLSSEDGEEFKPQHDFFTKIGVKTSLELPGESLNLTCTGTTKGVTQRISEKLQQIRQCPGTSKEVIEATIAIPIQAREYPATSTPSLAAAAKPIIHDIVHDWNKASVIYNGLEKFHVASSPIKFPSTNAYNTVAQALQHSFTLPKILKKKDERKNSKQGPHCEQFLKNIGVIKVEAGEDVDHLCNHINKFVCFYSFFF